MDGWIDLGTLLVLYRRKAPLLKYIPAQCSPTFFNQSAFFTNLAFLPSCHPFLSAPNIVGHVGFFFFHSLHSTDSTRH